MIGRMTLDGVRLDDSAGRWALSDDTRLGVLPGTGITVSSVPGRHGSIPTPLRNYEAGSAAVGLIVTDNNEAGVPTGRHEQVLTNLAALYRLAAPIGRLPVLGYYPNPLLAAHRVADVRLLAGVEPEWPDPYTARIIFPFDIPGAFWRDAAPVTVTSAATASWTVATSTLDGSTAPITDPVISCAGPVTTVSVDDANGDGLLTWVGNVPAGRWLVIDPADYSAWNAASANTLAGTDVSGGLMTAPGGFTLTPATNGRVGWTLARSSSAINQITARRAFL